MEKRRMALINLCLEVKRIIEVDYGRSDFTFLLEQPDDEKEIVFPADYEAGINYKMPVCVVDLDYFETTALELGGEVWDICSCIIDISCVTKAESMDICEFILKKLVGNHPFYDFSTEADTPDLNEPYDPGTLPSGVLTQWVVYGEDDFSQSTMKLTNKLDANFAKRYRNTLEGTIRYTRDWL